MVVITALNYIVLSGCVLMVVSLLLLLLNCRIDIAETLLIIGSFTMITAAIVSLIYVFGITNDILMELKQCLS